MGVPALNDVYHITNQLGYGQQHLMLRERYQQKLFHTELSKKKNSKRLSTFLNYIEDHKASFQQDKSGR